jgi:protein TonB
MAVGDGALSTLGDKVGNDPVQTGSLLSLLPSALIHGAVVLAIWLGLFSEEPIQPPATFITLAPAAAPAPEQAPPAPVVPAPDVAPEFEPLPLPETGMALPQPEPPTEPAEPVVDFTPPDLPEPESFPFDPKATRVAEPEPDAVALEKPKEEAKPKEPAKPKETKKKPEKPKKKETKKPTASAVAEKKVTPAPAATPAPPSASATPAKTSPSATPRSAPAATQSAAISDAPLRVTNPSLVGCPLEYPERARKRNQQGTVHLRYQIGTNGKATDITVIESSGHRLLDEAAQRIIADCKFQPQMRGDRAVPVLADQAMPFVLNN